MLDLCKSMSTWTSKNETYSVDFCSKNIFCSRTCVSFCPKQDFCKYIFWARETINVALQIYLKCIETILLSVFYWLTATRRPRKFMLGSELVICTIAIKRG